MNKSEKQNAGNIQAVKRMPQYLRLFNDMFRYGRQYISSVEIASKLSLKPISVKKDMLLAQAPGKTRLGYNVKGSIAAIQRFLGWQKERDVCLVGYGKLGSALFHYEGFKKHGFNMVAAFDTDITKTNGKNIFMSQIKIRNFFYGKVFKNQRGHLALNQCYLVFQTVRKRG